MRREDFHIFHVEKIIFFTFWTAELLRLDIISCYCRQWKGQRIFVPYYSGKKRKALSSDPYIDYGEISLVFLPKYFLLRRCEWQIFEIDNNRLGFGQIEGHLLNISIFIHDYKQSPSLLVSSHRWLLEDWGGGHRSYYTSLYITDSKQG